MKDVSIRVMNMVRRTLVQNADISNQALYAAAVALDPSIAKLTLRQFHARYPLQVRRWELGGPQPLRLRQSVYGEGSDVQELGDGESTIVAEPEPVPEPTHSAAPWPMEFWPEAASVRPPREPARPVVRAPEPVERPAAASARSAAVGAARPRARPQVEAERGRRDRVRAILLDFALQVSRAETVPDLVRMLGGIDDHVNLVMTADG